MSFLVDPATVQQYKANVAFLLQQKGSKLRHAVTEDTYYGKAGKVVDQLGAVNMQRRTSRHSDMPLISTPHDARWVYPYDDEWADLIDKQDKLRQIVELTSPYAINGANAAGRAYDDEIIRAFFADAKTGEDGTTTTTFPAAQQVAVGVGAGGPTGMNIAKLRAAKKILMANEVDIEVEPLFGALTAEQHDDLLAETEAISLDYNNKPVLVDGKITSFMGFNFIHCERLGTDGSGYRRNPFWAKSGMHLGIWDDIEVDISRRNDKSGRPWQVYVGITHGATRLEEGKVVEVLNSEV